MSREAYGVIIGVGVLIAISLPAELFLIVLSLLSFLISRELSKALGLKNFYYFSPLLFLAGILSPALVLIFSSLAALYYGYRTWSLENFLKAFFLSFYPPFFLVYLFLLKQMGTNLLLIYIISFWINDVFAYYIGKNLGKTPLFPKLSPKKTLEGFLGGYIPAVAFMGLALPFDTFYSLFVAFLTVLLGVVGDYFKSFIKRQLGIKDFSNVLGGHGGFTDRFDDVVFAAPLYYLLIQGAR
ncbi:phosphatidate cytidylyltransferase [Aquifex sp.]